MAWFSLLQIDVEVGEPDTSENPTQSLEIHNIVWRRTQLETQTVGLGTCLETCQS